MMIKYLRRNLIHSGIVFGALACWMLGNEAAVWLTEAMR